jgi:HK97 family phage major capsid protein
LSKLAVLASSPAYLRAWGEMLREGGIANAVLSPEEVEAVRQVRAESRAMSLTTTEGGYLVPTQLDPSLIISSDGSSNPIRRVARRVVATGNVWYGVSAAATQFSWDDEEEQVSDDTSVFAQPSVTIHKGQGFIPLSYEIFEDGANVTQEVQKLLVFGKDTLEETAFVTGSGTGEPFGFITALAGTASEVSSITNDVLGSADVYALDQALPARFRRSSKAAWFANRAIWNRIAQMETSNGSTLFPGVVGNPGTLQGVPTYEAEAMDGTLGTGVDYVLCWGDWDHWIVADRQSTVEFIPNLFGANGRPTGQRGIFMWHRVGSDSVLDGAFRLLEV